MCAKSSLLHFHIITHDHLSIALFLLYVTLKNGSSDLCDDCSTNYFDRQIFSALCLFQADGIIPALCSSISLATKKTKASNTIKAEMTIVGGHTLFSVGMCYATHAPNTDESPTMLKPLCNGVSYDAPILSGTDITLPGY